MSELELPGYSDAVLIGVGGVGRVYRATRVSTGGPVAIKELYDVASASPAWRRARRELDVMLRLKEHPGVTSVEEVVEGPDGPCIVMEYVSGGNLHDRLAAGPLTLPELVLVGRQASDALGAAHELGIVHRDVKPANLLVSAFGHVKVCDFGIAMLTRGVGGTTRTHSLTLGYASPEELDEADDIGPPADVYSLAVTLQHLLTGQRPSVRQRMVGDDALQARALLAEPLEQFVLQRLVAARAQEPAARPTMSELVASFDAVGAQLGLRRIDRLSVGAEVGQPRNDRTSVAADQSPSPPPPAPPPPPRSPEPPPPPRHPAPPPPAEPAAVAARDEAQSDHAGWSYARRRWPPAGVVAAVAALVVAAAVATVFALGIGRGDDDGAQAGTDPDGVPRTTAASTAGDGSDGPNAPAAVVATGPTAVPTTVQLAPRPTQQLVPVATTSAADPEEAARAELDRLVAEDRRFVDTNLLGFHVVQVAGKELGAFDDQDGIVYTAQALVAKYDELNERFGRVVIIKQDEYNHEVARPSLYQFLIAQPFETQDAGTEWCRNQGLQVPDLCFARERLSRA